MAASSSTGPPEYQVAPEAALAHGPSHAMPVSTSQVQLLKAMEKHHADPARSPPGLWSHRQSPGPLHPRQHEQQWAEVHDRPGSGVFEDLNVVDWGGGDDAPVQPEVMPAR